MHYLLQVEDGYHVEGRPFGERVDALVLQLVSMTSAMAAAVLDSKEASQRQAC